MNAGGTTTSAERRAGLEPRPRTSRRARNRRARRDLVIDVVMTAAAVAAEQWSASLTDVSAAPLGWAGALAGAALLGLRARGTYRPRLGTSYLEDLRAVVSATAVAAMSVTFAHLLLEEDPFAVSEAVRLWLFLSVYIAAGRAAVRLFESRSWMVGARGRRTVIVGAGRTGHLIARRLEERPELGLQPVGFLDADPLDPEKGSGLRVLGGPAELAQVVRDGGIEHVILSFSKASPEAEMGIVRQASELGVAVSVVPRLFESVPDGIRLERMGGVPLLSIYPSDVRSWQISLKYALDRPAALLLIVLLSPLLALAAAVVLASVGRPILFRQERTGLDGREFGMLKFRTLRGDPAELGESDADWAAEVVGARDFADAETRDSQRGTPITDILRSWGIDELPQLFNVLKGDMSLIGPRPERSAYVQMFLGRVPRYDDRHRVKAGITGWAQVHGLRGKTSLADRVAWDNYYIENWSFWLDLKVLALTALALFRGSR